MKQVPQRPYEIVIKIGSDSLADMASSLENIAFDIYRIRENGHQNPHTITSGSPSSGYTLSLVKTETASHDEYFRQIEEWLEARKMEPKP